MATLHVPTFESQPNIPLILKKHLSQVTQIPFPVRLLEQADGDLASHFRLSYDQLRSLPRQARRALQRQLAKSNVAYDLTDKLRSNKTSRSLRHKLAWSLAGAALLLALGQQVQAANITVTTKKADINTTDGLCSLAEAIINANNDAPTYADCAAGSGADIIQLPRGTHTITTIVGPYALPTITSAITIEGDKSKIVRSKKALAASVIGTSVSGDLTLDNVTVSGGNTVSSGGGIVNYGTLTLNYSTISKNTAVGYGGGIANAGTLTVLNSKIEKNKAGYGGGIADNGGVTTLQNSTVQRNTAYSGGGIYSVENSGSDVTISNSTVTGNKAQLHYFSGLGGGVYNGSGNALTIDSSVISKNKASGVGVAGFGGGIRNGIFSTFTAINSTITGNKADFFGGIDCAPADTTIENSTISKNAAKYGGGGMGWLGGSQYVSLTITNSTISGNKASWGGGIRFGPSYYGIATIDNSTITKNQAVQYGGGLYSAGILILNRSLISGNKIKTSGFGREIYNYLPFGTVIANNYNLFGFNGDAGVVGFGPGATDIVPPVGIKTSKILSGALKDNGGPTAANGKPNSTHALVVGSPAVDAAPCVLGTDQRGVSRPQGAACDIGAFELAPQ